VTGLVNQCYVNGCSDTNRYPLAPIAARNGSPSFELRGIGAARDWLYSEFQKAAETSQGRMALAGRQCTLGAFHRRDLLSVGVDDDTNRNRPPGGGHDTAGCYPIRTNCGR
jgi:hypothetical protein